MRILFAKNGDQHVGAVHLFLPRGLHVQHGALDDALEPERRLGFDVVLALDRRRVLVDEADDVLTQLFDVAAAGAHGFGGRGVVEQGEQQVLDGDEFVAFLPGLDKGHLQTDFQFLRNHPSFPP